MCEKNEQKFADFDQYTLHTSYPFSIYLQKRPLFSNGDIYKTKHDYIILFTKFNFGITYIYKLVLIIG